MGGIQLVQVGILKNYDGTSSRVLYFKAVKFTVFEITHTLILAVDFHDHGWLWILVTCRVELNSLLYVRGELQTKDTMLLCTNPNGKCYFNLVIMKYIPSLIVRLIYFVRKIILIIPNIECLQHTE